MLPGIKIGIFLEMEFHVKACVGLNKVKLLRNDKSHMRIWLELSHIQHLISMLYGKNRGHQ